MPNYFGGSDNVPNDNTLQSPLHILYKSMGFALLERMWRAKIVEVRIRHLCLRLSQLCGRPAVLSGNYALGIYAAVSKGFLLYGARSN